MNMWPFFTLIFVAHAAEVFGTAGYYCSVNTFATNSVGMQFTKEPVPIEYGFEDKFKSLHCCVKGYRSIEWFKDGVPYPWQAELSNLILYPEAANQTLYTSSATRSDSGNYTCRISNETHTDVHSIRLNILDKPIDHPRTMFISKDQWLNEGDELRLFCEALVGKSYLADARSDLRWRKIWPNGTEGDLLPSQNETRTHRDDVIDIRGSYLRVARVTPQDFGAYVCVVHSNGAVATSTVNVHYKDGREPQTDSNASGVTVTVLGSGDPWGTAGGAPWRTLVICGVGGVLVLVSLVALHRRCSPRLLLAARQLRARTAGPERRARVLEKEFDVLVCYTAVDGELVRGALLPTLQLKYKYRVLPRQLPTGPDSWYSTLSPELVRCRALLAVVSPAQYAPPQLLHVLHALAALPVPPVVVLLQDLPKLKREAKESGAEAVRVVRALRPLAWRSVHDRAFWRALRPRLPVPLHYHCLARDDTTKTDTTKKSSDVTITNSGSLTALV